MMATNEDKPERDFRLVEVSSGREEGISTTIIFNGKRMIVNFLPLESLEGTIEEPLIRRHEASIDGAEEEELAVEENLDMIFDAGKPLFAQLAPPVAKRVQAMDLHSLINPKTLYLSFSRLMVKRKFWNKICRRSQTFHLLP
ncbi:b18d1ff3-4194-444e-8119-e9ba2d972b53 [Sclerotinia trifoliorum]|uniref:B18d1ff3-4194-444e-8119-e9ba2d972b53 n=1 Tax=Sclerotinia trifoliorum TaxID=28548 RepID=A0A8H2VS66_9HELO|nr:b18d1ff3-4194-444e-8119-e9ba2d972b53 [Sclerotinia trifoliorum]